MNYNSTMEKTISVQKMTEEKNIIQKKAAICLQNCNYSIVHDVAISMGMHIVKPEESWDLWWCNTPMDIKKAKHLKKYQGQKYKNSSTSTSLNS
ncbi:tubulin polyglutamylase TTLL6 [Aphis craccivora]|uniref:Tubulin polyglutamylase TTLL6 n=1 Tax=Aphis craccivora TaxID=307492 RepID=A0A6G0YG50_APHCR|nr:tubulin polyglutamylase TTLL6 [Aphis craccivora]